MLKGTAPTADMKRGLELEMEAASDYCKMQNVNFSPCGLIIHPDVPWLASSPDGLVYDPLEHPSFGLVEIKNPNVKGFVDCKGSMPTTDKFKVYITGLEWCDIVVCAHEDILVERIHRDPVVFSLIREK
ncbi:unnamed protein product, partial [Coregonus sp. 'balchen']